MKTRDFFFELPEKLIAQYPAEKRDDSRLMTVNRKTGEIAHRMVGELPDILPPAACMVFNNSRVRKARLFGRVKDSGGSVEFLFLKPRSPNRWQVLTNRAKRQKSGRIYVFPEDVEGILEKDGNGECYIQFSRPLREDYFERNGRMPLPPYIHRDDTPFDAERYQTVYAGPEGSSASPTAGLHFTEDMLSRIDRKGIRRVSVTLHVGLGTFLPVRTGTIEEHVMHEEDYFIGRDEADIITGAKNSCRPIIAVGTTTVRVLESAWVENRLTPGQNATRIFIYPGYGFRAVDILLTNFHTPGSTLLMLVAAFGGKALIGEAYREAVKNEYRFFSYGDAMLIF
jgi:S-adenosylmethionine:tRNA ribosyltransferase-isomerase